VILVAALCLQFLLGVLCGLCLFPRIIRSWVNAASHEVVEKEKTKVGRFGPLMVKVAGTSGSREVKISYQTTE
jgi:hypothetical protein